MTSLIRSRWAAIGAAVAVTLGAGGLISVNAANDTSSLVPITPERILDTRSSDRVGSLDTAGASDPYRLKITGTASIPSTGVTGVSLNVTAVETQTNDFGGFVSVYPCASVSTTKPDVSNMNFGSGQTIANAVTVPVSADGYICLYVYGTAHLLVDANGYYTQTSATPGEQGPAGPVNRITDEQIARLAWYDDPGRPATIDVGDGPEVLGFDGTNIYSSNYSDDTVSVIDPATNTVTDTIDVGNGPGGFIYDGTSIYIANYDAGTVSVIDPTANTISGTITGFDGPWGGVVVDNTLYISNNASNTVSVVDPASNTVTSAIAVGLNPAGIAFDGTNIYVANFDEDTVSIIDPATNTVTATINVGSSPREVITDGANIYFTETVDDTVSVIDPATNTVTATINVGDRPYGLTFDGTNIYVANQNDDTISVINPATNTVTTTIDVGNGPTYLLFDGTNIYVSARNEDKVWKIRPF